MSKLHEATGMGQSIWLNGFDRPFIHNHRLSKLIKLGVHGITTHPQTIATALAASHDYDQQLQELVHKGHDIGQIAERLLFTDIQTAVDLIHPIYERTAAVDGYVSLDLNPVLTANADEMVSEGLRLAYDIDRVNVMIQIPATPIGLQAIEQLIGEGINVNATHIYTVETYEKVAQAYLAGLDYFWSHMSVWRLPPTSTATLPVTQLDQALATQLPETTFPDEPTSATAGVALATLLYGRFQQIFNGAEWHALAKQGSHRQRPLWASSSDPHYLHTLMAPHTIHSLPAAHIATFLAESRLHNTLTTAQDKAQQILADLTQQGVTLLTLEKQLQAEATTDLCHAYQQLADTVLRRRDQLATIF